MQFKEKFMSQFIIIKYLIYYSKKYKESILIGINPLTLTKSRTNSKIKILIIKVIVQLIIIILLLINLKL